MSRIYHDQTEISELKKLGEKNPENIISAQVFTNIKKNINRQKNIAMDLMYAVRIENNLDSYGVDFLQRIQEFYDQVLTLRALIYYKLMKLQIYPGLYRIVCIADTGEPVVLWKGPMGRKYEVCILKENDHFDAIKDVSSFFKMRNFCVDCEKPFDKERDHTKSCKVAEEKTA